MTDTQQTVRLHYFAGRGRAETTRWMLAANGIAFENIPITTPEALQALRDSGRLPFDQMPLLEIDGHCLSQSTAMIRYLARKGGLYGETDREALGCDMIAGAAADFAETAMQYAFQPTAEIGAAKLRAAQAKFGPKFEAWLQRAGGEWMVGGRTSFADVVLTEALSAYVEILPDILSDTPLLAALRQRVVALPGIAAYLASPNRWPTPDEAYVIGVAKVLRRALPPHMPDPDRFVARPG